MFGLRTKTLLVTLVAVLGLGGAGCDRCEDKCEEYRQDLNVDRVNAARDNATFISSHPSNSGSAMVRIQLLGAIGVNNNPVDDELWVEVDGQRRFELAYPNTREGQTAELLARDLPRGRAVNIAVKFRDFGGGEGHLNARFSGRLFPGGTRDVRLTRTDGPGIVPGVVMTLAQGSFYRTVVDYPDGCECGE